MARSALDHSIRGLASTVNDLRRLLVINIELISYRPREHNARPTFTNPLFACLTVLLLYCGLGLQSAGWQHQLSTVKERSTNARRMIATDGLNYSTRHGTNEHI
ncbi:hypothetical protein EVAR_16341_1 [Eumeta japonica]|uniref:Uncharacterized protein n=1 Tax=Eumeta variegata TaxID=151549 RepID=A0A4C1VF24_EUMVA|nr:hypothetical protein EVAR_16341_1 [Eumeta japonica]